MFSLQIILLPSSLPPPPLYFSTDKSVWQVPGSIALAGAHCWKAQVYQPLGCNSVWELALPKVEVPGLPGHQPTLSNTVVKERQNWLLVFFLRSSFISYTWVCRQICKCIIYINSMLINIVCAFMFMDFLRRSVWWWRSICFSCASCSSKKWPGTC